mmetsp:Transcript_127782/g.238876  ORF Transcript_127782/g.238876 Transcript_127782/m.238876 type:complete len:307 (-) Transcript_127782:427-1347(-)
MLAILCVPYQDLEDLDQREHGEFPTVVELAQDAYKSQRVIGAGPHADQAVWRGIFLEEILAMVDRCSYTLIAETSNSKSAPEFVPHAYPLAAMLVIHQCSLHQALSNSTGIVLLIRDLYKLLNARSCILCRYIDEQGTQSTQSADLSLQACLHGILHKHLERLLLGKQRSVDYTFCEIPRTQEMKMHHLLIYNLLPSCILIFVALTSCVSPRLASLKDALLVWGRKIWTLQELHQGLKGQLGKHRTCQDLCTEGFCPTGQGRKPHVRGLRGHGEEVYAIIWISGFSRDPLLAVQHQVLDHVFPSSL